MKIAVKIIAGCVWLGFVVWFSIYCNGWFSDFLNFIKIKIFGDDISPSIDFAINIIPWNCFVSFLICLPLLLIKNRRMSALMEIGFTIVFFLFLLMWNILAVVYLWIFFPESIGTLSVTFSEFKSYALDDGWTLFQFWSAWCAFIILSNAVSIAMVFSISLAQKSKRSLILS
jgi:hypothetical protein